VHKALRALTAFVTNAREHCAAGAAYQAGPRFEEGASGSERE
jgi:hypothetical protein